MHRLAMVALFAAAPAWADDAEDDAHGKPTAVRVELAGTTARMVAKFAFELDGPGQFSNTLMFETPDRSVVTSGAVIIGGKRHRLRLEKADVASRAFDALTLKPGRDGDRAWAFVFDRPSDVVRLDVLAPRKAKLELELVLEAPTCFYNDRRYVELPASWWRRLQRSAEPHEARIAAACRIVDLAGRDSHFVGFASGHLAKRPAGEARIGAFAGRLPLDTIQLARIELDIARRLSEVPKDLHTAIIVDHSRSMSNDELEIQRAIVAAYVRAAPTSRVQLIGYARRSEAMLPGWMVASHAASRIDAAVLSAPPRNGSNLDAALTEASRWLARVNGTKRILLFSDERLREGLSGAPQALRQLIADDVLVHVVRPSPGEVELVRRDSLLSPLVIETGGIQVFGGGGDEQPLDVTMLLRPTSIDRIEVSAVGWQRTIGTDDVECEESLHEGHGCEMWIEGNAHAGPITVTGLLWNTPFKRVLRADVSQARTLARMLSVSPSVDHELREQIDHVAFAVNSVWSLFGTWGGSGGYEDVGGFGTIGIGHFGTRSHDGGFGTGRFLPGAGQVDLTEQLQPAIAKCKPGDARIEVGVELTLQEIVAVGVVVTPADPALRECVVEAIWDTTLRIPSPQPFATSRVAFGNKR